MAEPIRADEVVAETVEWLWQDRIPRGMITVIGGRPEQGKGLLMAHLAAYVSRMRIDDPTEKKGWRRGQVLYSAVEDSNSLMTVPRLQGAGALMNNIFLWKFRVPDHQKEMEAHVLERKIDLIIMDPVAAHLGKGISRHSDSIRDVLTPLSDFADAAPTRPAIVMVEHVLKRFNRHAHPLTAIGGTGSGLPAAARMAFIFGKDPDDEDRRVLCAVKNNIRDTPKALVFEVDTAALEELDSEIPVLMDPPSEEEFDPIRLLVNDESSRRHSTIGRPADKREAAAEWLTNYLWDNYKGINAPSGKVIEDSKQMGMNLKTLRRAAVDLEIEKNPPGGGPKCTWSLSQDIIDALTAADAEDEVVVDATGTEPLMTEADFEALLAGTAPPQPGGLGQPVGESADEEESEGDA